MILINQVTNSVSGWNAGERIYEKWAGKTLTELAPVNAVSAVYNNERIERCSFDSVIIKDEEQVLFVCVDFGGSGDIFDLFLDAGELLYFGIFSNTGSKLLDKTGITDLIFPKLPTGIPTASTDTGGTNFGFNVNNQVGNNIPIPVVYGKRRVGGVVAQLYTRFNSFGDEVLHCVMVVSEGPIQAIGQYTSDQDDLTGENVPDSLKFDDLFAKDLDDVTVALRIGSSTQTVMKGFEEQTTRYEHNFTLEQNKNFIWTTQDRVHSLDLNINFPQGLRYTDPKNGKTSSESIFLTIETFSEDGSRLIQSEPFIYARNKSGNFGITKTIEMPSYGKYQVKVRRTNREDYLDKQNHQDMAVISAINENRKFGIAHRDRALIGIRVVASQQLSGGLPEISVIAKGRKVYNPFTDTTEWTRNRALICLDWMTNKYGLGGKIDITDVNLDAFEEWYDDCDELIDPWTDAPATSTPESDSANTSSASPVITGTWTSTTKWGSWVAEVTARSAGVSVTVRYRFTPDDDSPGTVEDYTIVHSSTSAAAIAYGISASCDNLAVWVVGDKWTFRVLKEPRYRCDVIVDGVNSAYSVMVELAKSGRANIFPVGSLWSVDLQKRKAVLGGLFAENSNVVGSGISVSIDSLLSRNNIVEVDFVDAERDYEQDKVTVEIEGLNESSLEPSTLTASLLGVTRRTEAARTADFFKRIQMYQRENASFSAGVEAITLVPGQVFKANIPNKVKSYTGRVIAQTVSTVTLDQAVSLKANKIYTFSERTKDDGIVETNFTVGSDVTTQTISVAPQDVDSSFNPFMIGVKGQEGKLYLCNSIRPSGDNENRSITGALYTDYIYGDDAPPRAFSFITEDLGDAPANVTDLAVVETVASNKSTLTISWTASVGAPAAISYNVYKRIAGGSFVFVGNTDDTTISTVEVLDTGIVVGFAVQPVSLAGATLPIASVSSVSYAIRRKGNVLIVYPGNVPTFTLTPGSGNNATLSWGTVSDVDGYEIRVGGWLGGIPIYRSTGTSFAIKLNNVPVQYYIRAFNVVSGERFYSPDFKLITTTPTTLSGYTVEKYDELIDFSVGGVFQNCTPIEWTEFDSAYSVLQLSQEAAMRYETDVIDLGSGGATHISVDVRCSSYYISNADDLNFDMDHFSFDGEINADYLDIKVFALVSDNGTTFSTAAITSSLNDNIITSSGRRYFKFAVQIGLKSQTGQPDLLPVLGQIRQLRIALHRNA
jgi:hypothetical protein